MKHRLLFILLILAILAGCAQSDAPQSAADSAANEPSASESGLSSSAEEPSEAEPDIDYGFIDLEDPQSTQTDRVLMALVWSGIAQSSWETPEQADPDALVGFFHMMSNALFQEIEVRYDQYDKDDETGNILIPAEEIEQAVQRRFDVSAGHLRESTYYWSDGNVYWYGGSGSTQNAKILDVEQDGELHTVHYELYTDTKLFGTGALEVRISGEDYQYQSNKMTPAPLSPEEQAIQDSLLQIRPDMPQEEKILALLVNTGNAFQSWSDPEELSPTDLIKTYTFLVDLGEQEIPEDAPRDRYYREPFLDEQLVEDVVLAHFDTDAEFLRGTHRYDPERRLYRVSLMQSQVQCVFKGSDREGDTLTIRYEIYQDLALSCRGELVAELDESGGYLYRSCQVEWLG